MEAKIKQAAKIVNDRLKCIKGVDRNFVVQTIMSSFGPGMMMHSTTFDKSRVLQSKTQGFHCLVDLNNYKSVIDACEKEIEETCGDISTEFLASQIGDFEYLLNDAFAGKNAKKFLLSVGGCEKTFNHFRSYYQWLTTDFLVDLVSKLPMNHGYLTVFLQYNLPLWYLNAKLEWLNKMSAGQIRKMRPSKSEYRDLVNSAPVPKACEITYSGVIHF